MANAGSGKKLVSLEIIGATTKHGPIPGPYMGDFNGYSEDLFRTHRSGPDFEYIFDHKHYINGHPYTVTIGFSEAIKKLCHEGGRVFKVTVNKQPFANDLDVFKESGGCKHVLIMTKEMTPVNGIFTISFEGIDQHNAMLSFVSIKAVDENVC